MHDVSVNVYIVREDTRRVRSGSRVKSRPPVQKREEMPIYSENATFFSSLRSAEGRVTKASPMHSLVCMYGYSTVRSNDGNKKRVEIQLNLFQAYT